MVLRGGRLLREAVLMQNALSANDGSCTAAKGAALLDLVFAVVDTCLRLVEEGVPVATLGWMDAGVEREDALGKSGWRPIKPGDRVDVVLALTEEQTNKNPITVEGAPTREGTPPVTVRNFNTVDGLLNNTTVKVLVENIRVVGTLLPPPPAQEGGNQGATTGNAAPSLNGQSQITLLEVTPQQAELIRFTQLDGNLSLVLRAPGDAEAAPVKTTGITVRELVDKYGVLPPKIILTEQP